MNKKTINLSFDDKNVVTKLFGARTIVELKSYVSSKKLDKFLNELGYRTLPEPVLNVFNKYGYKYDHKLGGWATITTGVAVLNKEDTPDSTKGVRIAMSKAKVKAYSRANRCFLNIRNIFASTSEMFSPFKMLYYMNEESQALERVIETGSSNPNKN